MNVPAKVILAGEHAVVHGFPALALPWPGLGVEVEVERTDGPLVIAGDRPGIDVAGLEAAAGATLTRLGRPPAGLTLTLRSTIPPGAGLGSSAATAVAVVRAVAQAVGARLAADELRELADVAERHAHGRPSGLDVATVTADGPILFVKGHPAEPVAAAFTPALLVADSGQARDTRAAVAAVADKLDRDPGRHRAALEVLGGAALAGAQALRAGDAPALGEAMNLAQLALVGLDVSHPALDRLTAAALEAGALGAKLTGAGRGGCVVALARDAGQLPALAAALRAAGAHEVYMS